MDILAHALALISLACVPAFVVGFGMLLSRRRRRRGWQTMIVSLVIGILGVFLFGELTEQEARKAGFENSDDRRMAHEAGLVDAKAFYADAPTIRARVVQKREAAKAAQEKRDREDREAAEANEHEDQRRKAQAAADALTELAAPAPLDHQPPMNPDFGRGYYNYTRWLRTPSGYPFVRAREAVPFCASPYAVKEATDAVKAKDERWIATLRGCFLASKNTAVEWSKESVGGMPVVELRIKDPAGGRMTVYAPDMTTAGIAFWMGFSDPDEIRTRQVGRANSSK